MAINFTAAKNYSWMSQASYLDLSTVISGNADSLVNWLKSSTLNADKKFVSDQATTFTDRTTGYSFISQLPNTTNGASLTVFKSNENNTYTIAVRGTEPDQQFGVDLFDADVIGVVLAGQAKRQLFDAYRYYKQLTTGLNAPVTYTQSELFDMALLVTGKSNPALLTGSNYLGNDSGLGLVSPNATVNFTGHSLGGHVATLLAQFIAKNSAGNVGDIVTYNAPGQGGIIAEIAKLFGIEMASQTIADKVTNIIGEGGIKVTAEIGSRPGTIENIFIEKEANPISNHSIVKLSDSLAVYNLFAKLDPSLDDAKLKALIQSASGAMPDSLERSLDELRAVFFGSTSLTTNKTPTDTRDPFYTNLTTLQNDNAFKALVGKVTLTPPSASLGTTSRTDFASLLTLLTLSPFTLKATTGNEAAVQTILQAKWQTEYADWTADQALTSAQRAAGQATYSDHYLTDRATYLSWLLKTNVVDNLTLNGLDYGDLDSKGWEFTDKTLNQTISISGLQDVDHNPSPHKIIFGSAGNDSDLTGGDEADSVYGGKGNDVLNGGDGNDYLEGNADNDILKGGIGKDTLLGGTGNDTLEGGKDNDTLSAGVGDDTYQYTSGDGWDTIDDSDGQGQIKIGTDILSGGKETGVGTGLWQSTDKKYEYSLYTESDGRKTLNIISGTDRLFVKNFTDGKLGITLGVNTPVVPPPAQNTETLNTGETYSVKSGYDTSWSITGNALDSNIWGGKADDEIAGQSGFDRIYGDRGNDRIYGGAIVDTAVAIAAATQYQRATAATNDYLSGNSGNDLIIANVASFSFGGGGSDTIIGGGDADFVEGDGDPGSSNQYITGAPWLYPMTGAALDFEPNKKTFYYTFNENGQTVRYARLSGTVSEVSGETYADTIITGAGGDIVLGDRGDDNISLGSGSDIGIGGAGSDIIDGGDDRDALFGDFNWDAGAAPANETANERQIRVGLEGQYHGNDIIDGGAGDDYIEGNGGADVLRGGSDNDQIMGDDMITPGAWHGNDSLDGGTGNDSLWGGGGDDDLYGGDGDDYMEGDDNVRFDVQFHGDDYLSGGAGDDTLIGGGADDELHGGDGNDSLFGDDTADVPLVASAHGKDSLYGENGDDLLWGGGGDDLLDGGEGKDSLNGGSGNDILLGDAGADYLQGGVGNDQLFGGNGNDVQAAEEGDDLLDGGFGDDILDGGDGNDTLVGGGGGDVLSGGNGDDTYVFRTGDSALTVGGLLEAVYEAGGNDTVRIEGVSSADLKVSAVSDGYLQIEYSPTDKFVIRGGVAGVIENYVINGEQLTTAQLIGRNSSVAIRGVDSSGNQFVAGGNQGETIYSYGNTTLSGGRGNDVYQSLGGNNTYIYNLGDDIDSIYDFNPKVGDQGQALINTLSFGVGITVNDITIKANVYAVAHGNIEFHIGNADDQYVGIAGYDQSTIGHIDRFTFADGTVLSYQALLQQRGVELLAVDNTPLIGQSFVNQMIGNSGWNTYQVNYANNQVVEMADGGLDTVEASIDYQLTANVENLTLTGSAITGSGNDLSNLLTGNDQNNILNGFVGNDHLVGGGGNDSLDGGAGDDILDGGLGNDTYIFRKGSGNDTITNNDNTMGRVDTLVLEGLYSTDVRIEIRNYHDLVFVVKDTGESINIQSYFVADSYKIDAVRFADGTVWDRAAILNGFSVKGTAGNDVLYAANGTNTTLFGLAGNDQIQGDSGNDQLFGDEGADTLLGGSGNDSLDGGIGNDILNGGDGSDTYFFRRGSGTDTINNSFDQSPGRVDTLVLDGLNVSDVRFEIQSRSDLAFVIKDTGESISVQNFFNWPFSQIDVVKFADGTTWDYATLIANSYVYGTDSGETLEAFETVGTQIFGLGGSDHLRGHGGNDSLIGGDGNDSLMGDDGDDYLDGGAGVDQLQGDLGNDSLFGGSGNDTLSGVEGNDRLDGGAGDDWLDGGVGNDIYVFRRGSGNDTISNYSDSVEEKVDTLVLEGLNVNDIRVEKRSSSDLVFVIIDTGETITVQYFFGNDSYKIDAVAFADGTTWDRSAIVNNVSMYGTAGNDTLVGISNLANHIYGKEGNDTLYGGVLGDVLVGDAGEDLLLGYDGNDSLAGGADNDTLYGMNGNDDLDGGAGNDYLRSDEGNDVLDGGAGNDTLTGGNGNDSLDGGYGDDDLTGGSGNDTYVFRRGGGNDTIFNQDSDAGRVDSLVLEGLSTADIRCEKRGDYDLAFVIKDTGDSISIQGFFYSDEQKIDSVIFADGTIWDRSAMLQNFGVYGTASDDTLSADNTIGSHLYGFEGNDTLYGRAGNDSLDGGADNDTLSGQGGADVLDGGSGDDSLAGDDGNDLLDGGAGNDSLTGGLGNDTYVFRQGGGNDIINNYDSGVDRLDKVVLEGLNVTDIRLEKSGNYDLSIVIKNSGESITLQNYFNNSVYQIDAVTFADGTTWDRAALLNNFAVYGTAGNDELSAVSNVASRVYGYEGNDTLLGGSGNDTLIGGIGDDTYGVDNAGDVVTEMAGEGTDLVQSSVTYTLGADVENLTLTGTIAINATGNTQDNVLIGNGSANILNGGTGADTLIGGAGDDTYVVDSADVVIVENASEGTDLVQSSLSYSLGANLEKLTLVGTSAINATGNALNNTLTGNAGDNVLDGGAGNDTLIGGAGNDTYVVDSTSDVVTEAASAGTDFVQSSVTYTLSANVENLTLTGTGDVNANGNTLVNVLAGNIGANVLDGGAGADTLIGGAGNDTYIVDNVGDVITENAAEGIDLVQSSVTYTLASEVENLTLTGAAAINGTGNALNNTLTGNAGNNILDGGAGADTLIGGTGNDTYVVDDVGDVVTEAASAGTDLAQSSITYTLAANVENLTLTGISAINGTGNTLANTLTGNSGDNILDGGTGIDTLIGGAGNDTYVIDTASDVVTEGAGAGTDLVQSSVTYTLVANVENLTLTGTAAINATGNTLANVLIGNSGINTLSGGTGADTMQGGAGNDIYVVDNVGDVIVEIANEGSDLVQSSVTYTLSAEVEKLTLTGTSNINAIGNASNNTLTGNAGNNILNGDAGNDSLIGGAGNDTYVVDSASDVITEAVSEGTDLVQSSVTYTLATNVENLTLTGTDAVNATGNTVANVLVGNSAANVLSGGTGADTMQGGAGDDTYVVDDVGDVVTEAASAGTDLVQSSLTYTLGSNLENLTLTGTTAINGTGNALANTLTGNSGANILNGGTGADSMVGGAGNDTYVVDNIGDVITEAASAGTDVVQSSVTYTLAANVENLTLTGTGAINATGNTLANTLTGNTGNNLLDGGAGNDTLIGGTGNDTYVVDSASDVITENASEGTDLVQSSATYTLAANVENLTLTGITAINGTGNTLNNLLIGNAAINTLSGGTGVDTMQGGAGDDIYVVDDTGDVVTELASEGTDMVQSSVTYTLATNVEKLTLTGTTAINGTGNTLANTLTGNSGDNILNGGTGADTLIGGAGNDTYVVDDVGDVVTEAASAGTDLVQSNIAYTLGTNVENLTLTGTTAINGTGNTLANVLTGNSGANVLDGGTGADTLVGGAGNDTYVVDNVGDVITENASEGTDLVQSSVTYTLAANVENLTLSGTSAINATGNTQNNALVGNSGINILDGGTGADTLTGGAGNDTYVVDNMGDVVVENLSEGTDLVQSSVTYTLAANVENLTLTGTAAINGIGNALDNVLTGNTAANTLTGGAGNDTYVVDNSGDVIVENASEGTDLVQSSVTYTLAANVENMMLTGITAINGTGNALNNSITGNSADNVLDGGAGTDTLVGGAGNDTYYVSTGDTVTEAASAGTDTVNSDATWTLGSNLENLTLSGTTAINGTGNTLANVLIGNSAANTLSGGTGADTMQGGAGDDIYVVDDAGDVVTEAASAGTDLVQSSVTYSLTSNVENLTLTGTTAINGVGNTLNNVLIGNSGANSLTGDAGNDALDGGAGADTLIGGLGDDTYTVDNALDVVTEIASEGTDTVNSSITLTLAANVEALVLSGSSAINGTGNALGNLVRGNTGNNVLDGGTGNDVLEGGAGNDTLTDASGTALFNGGAGTDTITGGASAEIYLGGLGNDTYTTGAGNDVILFNKGDGQDTFATGGTGSDTLSLGGSFAYSDLSFSKSSNDLILKVSATDQVTFKDWYAATPSKPVVNMQVIAEAMAGFSAGGSDPLLDQKVENFNFAGLVGAFDAARAANTGLTTWALTSALTNFQLAGSDTAAMGGDLAYQYGKNGTLAGIGLTSAQTVINDSNFGTQAQTLNPIANLQSGAVKLG
jgi:Ca2+-binding RTX toxin-like protein